MNAASHRSVTAGPRGDRCTRLALGAMLFTALIATAPAAGEGINFSWSDCGSHGGEIESFACGTNTGVHEAVASFVPPAGIDRFIGIEAEIGITAQNDLPDWWKFGSGACRSTSGFSASFDFTAGPSSCTDPWDGQATGGWLYDVGYGGPNHARLRVFAAMPESRALDPATEYYAFRVRLQNSKSTGSGSCSGCPTPVQLTLESIRLDQSAEPDASPVLATPIDRTAIFWQSTFGPLPEIHDVVPAAGTPGTPVGIHGTRLSGITSVRFGSLDAAFSVVSDDEISTVVPGAARSTPVYVSGPGGLATSRDLFIVAPQITGFAPERATAGSTVEITGINFTRVTVVQFNGVAAPFIVDTDTRILATVPAGASDGPIAVFNAAGSDESDGVFHVGPVPLPGGGLNLSWDDCGSAGSALETFACNTSSGAAFAMYASFGAPDNVRAMVSMTAVMEIVTRGSELPNWWKFGSGQCRATSLSSSFNFTSGPTSCLDPWEGNAVGGLAYDVGYGGPDRARVRIIAAVPNEMAVALTPGSQYYAFKLMLNRLKTAGTGSCSGCDVPMCIQLTGMQLYQTPSEGYDPVITQAGERNYVNWQSAFVCPTTAPPSLDVPNSAAERFALDRVVANRDGRSVSFSFRLAEATPAQVEVYDSGGRRWMAQRLDGYGVGPHEVQARPARPLASGVYFARIVQGQRSATRRFVYSR